MIVTGESVPSTGVWLGQRFAALTLVRLFLCLQPALALWGQAYFGPGDAKAGMAVFAEKRCMRCHSILGEGGRSAPDLARAPSGHLSSAELAAEMWNHAPAMWQKMRLEKETMPHFSAAEMTNLFAFIYSVRSLDEPGNAQRGRSVFADKCAACHAVTGHGTPGGPDLKQSPAYRNPVAWVQAMWNHAPAMRSSMAQRGMGWPQLEGDDMADLIAYVRTLADGRARVQIRQADPTRGRKTFAARHCDRCHSVTGGAGQGPNLQARGLPRTLGQLAGRMWNHGPDMWDNMRRLGIDWPRFSNQEMADLMAYLFAVRYFESGRNATNGRRVFADKGCAGCHHPGTGAAPGLGPWRGNASAAGVAAALWNHGPLMFAQMQERHVDWPRFRPGEMADLIEFLNLGAGKIPDRQAPASGVGGRP